MCEGRTCASSPSQMNAAFSKDYFKNHSFNLNFWVLVPFFLLIFQSILRYGMPIWFWKMVSLREKITFRFSNTVFSWKKWPSKFQWCFFHGKKAFWFLKQTFVIPFFGYHGTKWKDFSSKTPPNNYTRPSHEFFIQDGIYIFHVWPPFGEKAYSAWFCF